MESSHKNEPILIKDRSLLDNSFQTNKNYLQEGKCSPLSGKLHSDLSVSYGSTWIASSTNNVGSNVAKEQKLKFTNLSRRQKFVLVLCSITFFLEGIAYSIIAPFFPTKALSKGMSLVLSGFVFSGFQLVTFITSPLFGAYMRHLGPKFVILSGTFLAGSCTILFGLLDRCPSGMPFIVLAFVCRILESIGYTAYFTGLLSYITAEFPDDISTAFSIVETINGIGMMVGPAVGGVLYEFGGYELPFFLTGGLVLLNMVLFWIFTPDITPAPTKSTENVSQFSMLRSVTLDIALVTLVIAASARNFRNPILSLYLETFGLTEGLIGLIFVVPTLFYTCFCPLWGYLTDKKHLCLQLIVIGQIVFGIGYLIMGPSDILPFLPTSLWAIILGLVLCGTGFGCLFLPLFKLLQIGAVSVGFEKDSLETLSMISALLSTGYSLGAFIGTTAAGAMAEAFGFTNAFAAIGVVNILVALLLFAYFVFRKNHLRMIIQELSRT